MDILKLINELETLVENQNVLMGMTFNFRPDEYLDITNKIRASLPGELKHATKVAQDSEKIVDGARFTAEQLLEDANQEADQITRDARSTAEKHIREAEAHARKMVAEAEFNAKAVLTESQQKAEHVIRAAQNRSEQLVSQNEVVALANARAEEYLTKADIEALDLVRTAESDASDMRHGADDYAHQTMADLEQSLLELLSTVKRGKASIEAKVSSHVNGTAVKARRELETTTARS